ncbi:MAG: NAD(P)/FAD-dependent oxidoreductase [Acidimicrobiales bacterium]
MTGPTGSDVVVIGGGLVGTSLAYELVSAGATTVLIDRHDPGRATDAGAGILSPETNQDPDPGLFDFGLAAARHYEDLVGRLVEDGAADTGWSVTGSVLVAERPGDDALMEEAVGLAMSRCPASVVELDPGDLARHFPPLGPVRRALYNPAGRRVDGRVLNGAVGRAAAARGLQTIRAAVTGLDRDLDQGVVRGVTTSEGTVTATAVVVAGGAWSDEMAAMLGTTLPVTPLKGQIIHLLLPGTDCSDWSIVQPVLGFYLVPWPDGRVACGGTMEAAAGFDHRPTADGVHQLLRECLRSAPGLAQATVADIRVGSRPATPDGRPILGRLPGWSNAFAATGHGADGLLLGPYSARLVASCVLGRLSGAEATGRDIASAVLAMCSPERFAGERGS